MAENTLSYWAREHRMITILKLLNNLRRFLRIMTGG